MKQFILKFPETRLSAFTAWSFTNGIRIITTTTMPAGFFDLGGDSVKCYCAAEAEKEALVQASEWKEFLVAA